MICIGPAATTDHSPVVTDALLQTLKDGEAINQATAEAQIQASNKHWAAREAEAAALEARLPLAHEFMRTHKGWRQFECWLVNYSNIPIEVHHEILSWMSEPNYLAAFPLRRNELTGDNLVCSNLYGLMTCCKKHLEEIKNPPPTFAEQRAKELATNEANYQSVCNSHLTFVLGGWAVVAFTYFALSGSLGKIPPMFEILFLLAAWAWPLTLLVFIALVFFTFRWPKRSDRCQ